MLHTEDDYINPADIPQGLVKLAREQSAKVHQDTETPSYDKRIGGDWTVATSKGNISCDHLVLATGNYARENAKRVGLDLPRIACGCVPVLDHGSHPRIDRPQSGWPAETYPAQRQAP